MIEDLLTELADIGWTVSWAFQFEPDHWRVSICQLGEWNGYDQPDYRISHCADAPTFAEALEDAMAHRNDAVWQAGQKISTTSEPDAPTFTLASLGLAKPVKILRRM